MLIIFDYDGVLVDSLQRLTRIVDEATSKLGVGRPPIEKDFRTLSNLTFPSLLTTLEVPANRINEVTAHIFELQRQDPELPRMFSHMGDVVRSLSIKNQIIVVTSSFEAEVSKVFDANELKGIAKFILDGSDPRSKAERIRWAMSEFKMHPEEIYFIGDACSDIQNGKLAGVRTVAVTWGFHSREMLLEEKPDFLVDYPEQLLKVVGGEQI